MPVPLSAPRVRAGETVRAERKRRGWSVETAARAGGIGHMTWRKIESGKSVHDQSLYAVDRAFEWTFGHTIGAVHGEHELLAPVSAEPSQDSLDYSFSLKREKNNRYLTRHAFSDTSAPLNRFPETFEVLDSLAVPELKVIADTAYRLASEYGAKLSEIRECLDGIPRINWQDIAVSQIQDEDLRTRCIEAWETYMHEYEKITDIRSSITGMYAQPVAEMKNLDDILTQAQETSQNLKSAASRFHELGEAGGALRAPSGTKAQG